MPYVMTVTTFYTWALPSNTNDPDVLREIERLAPEEFHVRRAFGGFGVCCALSLGLYAAQGSCRRSSPLGCASRF